MDGRLDVGRAQAAQSHGALPSIAQVEDLRLSRNLPLLGPRDDSRSPSSAHRSQDAASERPSGGGGPASSVPLTYPLGAAASSPQVSSAASASLATYSRSSMSPRHGYPGRRRHSGHASTSTDARRTLAGRGGHSAPDESAADKKRRHSQKEMDRRQRFKDHVDKLRDNVPGCQTPPGSRPHSREHVMERTVEYVIGLARAGAPPRRTRVQPSSRARL